MNFKKILLAASVGITTFSTTNLYAESKAVPSQLTSAENYQLKSVLVANLDSLFPYPVQVTVGSINKDSNGMIIAKDVLLMSADEKNPNISINKVELDGLKVGSEVTKGFSIKVSGLSVSNLATTVASTNIVSGKVDTKSLAENKGFYSIFMNNLGQSIADFTINYNSSSDSLAVSFDSTYAKQKLAQGRIELSGIDLSDTKVDDDFLASIQNLIPNTTFKDAEFDADFTPLLKEVTVEYLGKSFKKTPALQIKASMGAIKGELKLDIAGKLGSDNHFNYNAVVDGINYSDSKLKELLENKNQVLDNAYIASDKGNMKFDFDFKKNYFSSSATIQQLFTLLGKDEINITIDSNRDFNGSKYIGDVELSANDLASFSASEVGVVDGKLKILPYIAVDPSSTTTDLYNCKDQLCLTQMNASFSNDGLLEKVARLANKDPNTTPQQILGSYGALLQLFAVQQDDKFLQKSLSSLAMFLQNPKNISVSINAKKPMNQNALLAMLASDAKSVQKNNPMKGGRVNLKSNNNLELLNNIQKLFKIDFEVNK